jgi:polyphosphate kinase 2 (PPK2 family)
LDAGGKDGTVNHVFAAFNPQGTSVASFKQPTPIELDHDFLWRVHPHAPPNGWVAIFNRSHYEDVLIARVHKLVDKPTWTARYERIRGFESGLRESHCARKEGLNYHKGSIGERKSASGAARAGDGRHCPF